MPRSLTAIILLASGNEIIPITLSFYVFIAASYSKALGSVFTYIDWRAILCDLDSLYAAVIETDEESVFRGGPVQTAGLDSVLAHPKLSEFPFFNILRLEKFNLEAD